MNKCEVDKTIEIVFLTKCVLQEGETVIGAAASADIMLAGLETHHCSVVLRSGAAMLLPREGSQSYVNNVLIDKPTKLSQGQLNL